MTPGVQAARRGGITHTLHEYAHDAGAESYGLEAAEKLGVDAARVFKTLVVQLDGRELAVAVLPVSDMLSMKKVARSLGAKKAAMAEAAAVERSTGYVLGGVCPLGQKKRLRTVIDASADRYETIFISAGRRGLELELAAADLAALLDADLSDLRQ